jgi:hypothetical protein
VHARQVLYHCATSPAPELHLVFLGCQGPLFCSCRYPSHCPPADVHPTRAETRPVSLTAVPTDLAPCQAYNPL